MLSAIFLTNLLRICWSSLFKDFRSLGVEIVRIHGSDRLGLGMKILQWTGGVGSVITQEAEKTTGQRGLLILSARSILDVLGYRWARA